MNRADVRPPGAADSVVQPRSGHAKPLGAGAICVAIVALGAGLRSFELGRLSFWYDEVVTMRLARAGSPGALVDRLFQIDATRAPLHPLLLQAWLEVFRTSEASARSLSVVCGVATIVLVFLIGRIVFDAPTGLWAAWLGALSPILIVYAREARMYAWLVLVTCCAWLALLALLRALPSQDHGLWAQPGGAGLLASARARDGGDSGSGGPDRRSSVLRRVFALAVRPSRGALCSSCPGSGITSIILPSFSAGVCHFGSCWAFRSGSSGATSGFWADCSCSSWRDSCGILAAGTSDERNNPLYGIGQVRRSCCCGFCAAALVALPLFASVLPHIRAGAIHGMLGACISGPGRRWAEVDAGSRSLSRRGSNDARVGACTWPAGVRPRAQGRLASIRTGGFASRLATGPAIASW